MSFHEDRQRLQEFNLVIRQRLEEAEAKIPELNELIERVASLSILPSLVLLGDIVMQRPYGMPNGPVDSAQILQAVLLIPGGLGVTVWDTEEYLALEQEDDGISRHAASHFIAFEDLSPGEKGILFSHLEPLVERFWSFYIAQLDSQP